MDKELIGNFYYELSKFFSDEHGLTLLDSEIQEIIYEVNKFQQIDQEKKKEAIAFGIWMRETGNENGITCWVNDETEYSEEQLYDKFKEQNK